MEGEKKYWEEHVRVGVCSTLEGIMEENEKQWQLGLMKTIMGVCMYLSQEI